MRGEEKLTAHFGEVVTLAFSVTMVRACRSADAAAHLLDNL